MQQGARDQRLGMRNEQLKKRYERPKMRHERLKTRCVRLETRYSLANSACWRSSLANGALRAALRSLPHVFPIVASEFGSSRSSLAPAELDQQTRTSSDSQAKTRAPKRGFVSHYVPLTPEAPTPQRAFRAERPA